MPRDTSQARRDLDREFRRGEDSEIDEATFRPNLDGMYGHDVPSVSSDPEQRRLAVERLRELLSA